MAVALSVLVVTRAVSGGSPRKCDDLVVAVVRGRRILDFADPEAAVLQATDRVITIQRVAAAE